MKTLVVIDACVRQSDSRTLRIVEPIIEALSKRYNVIRYDLPEMDIVPLNPGLFAERGLGEMTVLDVHNTDYLPEEELREQISSTIEEGLELAKMW